MSISSPSPLSSVGAENEIIVVRGSSRLSKSPFIRCINPLEKYQEGLISLFGHHLGNDKKSDSLIRNTIGMPFLSCNLFPSPTSDAGVTG